MKRIVLIGMMVWGAGCGGPQGGGGDSSQMTKGVSLGGTDMHHGGEQGELMLRSAGLLESNTTNRAVSTERKNNVGAGSGAESR